MTEQSDRWGDEFGDEYTKRNPTTAEDMQQLYVSRFGMERTAMNEEFLGSLDRSARILEVGCNSGIQLNLLSRMGFRDLYGIEINPSAVEKATDVNRGLGISFLRGTALDLPFKDGWFDLVYTSGVLIHVSPDDVDTVMREMCRCTRRFIWGFEYFAAEGYPEIPYRGRANMLWKTDFGRRFEAACPEVALIKESRYAYLDEPELVDEMYLLEKPG